MRRFFLLSFFEITLDGSFLNKDKGASFIEAFKKFFKSVVYVFIPVKDLSNVRIIFSLRFDMILSRR